MTSVALASGNLAEMRSLPGGITGALGREAMTSRPPVSGRVERPRSTARLTKGGQPYLDAHGCDVIASLPFDSSIQPSMQSSTLSSTQTSLAPHLTNLTVHKSGGFVRFNANNFASKSLCLPQNSRKKPSLSTLRMASRPKFVRKGGKGCFRRAGT